MRKDGFRPALLAAVAVLSFAMTASAQPPSPPKLRPDAALPETLSVETYRLWPGRAPEAKSDAPEETPTLTVFRPRQGGPVNGTAVIIAPGGAYIGLAGALEGTEPASWFTARGITAFVLTYRVGPDARLPIPLRDGARAVRFVRAHAVDFDVDPTRIGMMGFSAGGHLAATTAVDATPGNPGAADPIERVGSRPDFLILAYPWLEGMQIGPEGHSQYCDFAAMRGGPACDPRSYTQYLPLRHVSAATPPTFLYHTTADELVPVGGSIRFYTALVEHGVPAELHAFAVGPHGTGLGGRSPALSHWPELLDEWLRARGLLPAAVERRP